MREGHPHAIRRTRLRGREVAGRIGREGARAEQLQQPLLVWGRYLWGGEGVVVSTCMRGMTK